MSEMPSYTISKRVRGVWAKLVNWYGADNVTKHFGPLPPEEWCVEIDAIETKDQMVKILSEMRQKHPTWPPRFPEFELIVRAATRPFAEQSGPSPQEQLADFVLSHRTLTPRQRSVPWTWLSQRFDAYPAHDPKTLHRNWGIRITGVVIPADVESPGYRVMLADMQMETPIYREPVTPRTIDLTTVTKPIE